MPCGVLNTERARKRSIASTAHDVTDPPIVTAARPSTSPGVERSERPVITVPATIHGARSRNGTMSECQGSRSSVRSNASANAWRVETGRRRACRSMEISPGSS
jgi:hypothetical protein